MEAGAKQGMATGIATSGSIGIAGGQSHVLQQQQHGYEQSGENCSSEEGVLTARVHVPELYVSKCLQFPKDQLVWDVKQQCLASLPKVATWYRELKESFNYGLFCPPINGKAGKFLDEERRLGDYPFNGPVGYLELKYKRRVYKMLHLDEKQLKAMHTRTNLRRLLDYVANSQVEKIAKMCSKGLDPNFHCQETGETPLTLATSLKKPSKVIIALVNGGALLDYRTKEGLTAMHRAVERNSLEAVKTLLELGASPNYKDTKGLTPLYYSVIYKTDPMLCETLLHDHATIGAQDLQGWQEVHQACRNNLVQHLDHLLFYGADMNARNASGNTPLHVCAVNNTDSSCIRQLLFRGAQKDSLNYANQTPYQVAVIAGNMELAEVIKSYQLEEVVPFKGPPRYNPKRRSVAFGGGGVASGGLTTSCSASNLMGTLTRIPTSSEHHQHLLQHQQGLGSSSCTGTLTRTISMDQYTSGTLSRLPNAEKYPLGLVRGSLTSTASSTGASSLGATSSTSSTHSTTSSTSDNPYGTGSTKIQAQLVHEAYNLGTLTLRGHASGNSEIYGTLSRTPSAERPYPLQTGSRPSSELFPSPGQSLNVLGASRIPSSDKYSSLNRLNPSEHIQQQQQQQYSINNINNNNNNIHNMSNDDGEDVDDDDDDDDKVISDNNMRRAESHQSNLNRLPSVEKKSPNDISTLQRRIPSEKHLLQAAAAPALNSGNSTAVSMRNHPPDHHHHQIHPNLHIGNISRNEHHQNTLNRLSSEYQSPGNLLLRDPTARSPAAEHYQSLRIEGLTRLHEHRIELQHRLDIHGRTMEMPPSPSPSSRSLAPFSSASSSLSEGSNQPSGEDSASIVTDKSLGDTASDVISDSSGVGTSQSDTTNSITIPGTTVVCVESYTSGIAGHLNINQGDILEVTGATDCGLLEGVLRGQGTGLFPAHCVQEVRLRHTNIPLGPQIGREGRNRVLGRRESHHKYFATAPRLKKPICEIVDRVTSEPRTVVLHRSRKGFGFVLRGAKARSPLMELTPSARYPALQYLDDVDQGGVADLAGLRKGDFLIQINGEDVTTASHEHVVDLIRRSGELVRMTVISPVVSLPNSQSAAALPTSQPNPRQYATLPRKGSNAMPLGTGTLGRSPAPLPPRRDPKTTLSVGRARARSMVAGLEGGGEKDDRDDITSTGGKSSSAESIHLPQQASTASNTGQNTPVQPRTASIRSRPTSSRITAAELEELFQRQQGSASGQYGSSMMSSHFQAGQTTKSHPSSPTKSGRVYASVAEMKRKGKSSSRVRFFGGLGGGSDLHRDFHSTPDLNVQAQSAILGAKGHRSQEDVNALAGGRNALPPPNHPPPPPPVGQLVKVNVGPNAPDVVTPSSVYDNMAHIQQVKELAAASSEDGYGVMSSFRPSNSAKLYASPEDMKTVGYRSRSLPAHGGGTHIRKSHSLRAASNGNAPNFKKSQNSQTPNTSSNSSASNGIPGSNGTSHPPGTNNQYAQPLKTNRSHSLAGTRERKKKSLTTSSSASNLSTSSTGTPAIPEPDYSLSESDDEEDEDEDLGAGDEDEGEETDTEAQSEIAKELEKAAAREKLESTRETSGNSNSSTGSSGSGSVPHSFSVEEIQKVRTQLKSSKSHPNEFLMNQQTQQQLVEDGDNSSSGVSSDQDVPVGPPTGFDDPTANRNDNNPPPPASNLPGDKENNNPKRMNYSSGMLTRHAVSLAQLPPPIEADAEERDNDLFVPPPPEFNAGPSANNGQNDNELVFAPPPQFSDTRQQQQQQQQQQLQNRVKIIGAIPKSANNQVKPPTGRLHSQ